MRIPFKLYSFLLASCLLFINGTNNSKKAVPFISNYENVLGTSLQIKVMAGSEADAALAESRAMNEIDRLDHILSGYNQQSEFSRWMNSPAPAAVSPELFEILNLFDQWRVRSNGALDASAEVIGKLWKDAARLNTIPSQNEIDRAIDIVKQAHYKLDPVNHTAWRLDDAPLMLNTFTKSYIISKACDAALSSGNVNAIVLNIGGDIVIRGRHTEEVAISNPEADAENDPPVSTLLLSNKAVATSGNYRRGEMIAGKWYSHIVDPRNGKPAENVISSTVVAANAADAGALATAFSVLSPSESKALAATIPGAEYLIITRDGKHIESKGWKKLEAKPAEAVPLKVNTISSKENKWNNNYELLINLELATVGGFRSARPYIAVWIVDKDKNPVRNIAIWYNKPRYLNELRAWYFTYSRSFTTLSSSLSSTSGATRSPGKYTLKWDGKDDKGNLVNSGVYTVMIEAAREHGTYQLIKQEMDFSGIPAEIPLKGNTEISSASLDYRKKPENGK